MNLTKEINDVIIVKLPAEPGLRAETDCVIQQLQTDGHRSVIMDFSNVDIMTSMTLSGFLKVRELVTEQNNRLIFTNVNHLTRDIFKVCCFDSVFEFALDNDQALQAIEKCYCCLEAV